LCEEVKVLRFNNWDTVFASNYKALTYKELEEYISVNHHLPHIPSFSEMKDQNGIDVADFQMRLLRTLEEQALYILQMNNRIDCLEAENLILKNKIDSDSNH